MSSMRLGAEARWHTILSSCRFLQAFHNGLIGMSGSLALNLMTGLIESLVQKMCWLEGWIMVSVPLYTICWFS